MSFDVRLPPRLNIDVIKIGQGGAQGLIISTNKRKIEMETIFLSVANIFNATEWSRYGLLARKASRNAWPAANLHSSDLHRNKSASSRHLNCLPAMNPTVVIPKRWKLQPYSLFQRRSRQRKMKAQGLMTSMSCLIQCLHFAPVPWAPK